MAETWKREGGIPYIDLHMYSEPRLLSAPGSIHYRTGRRIITLSAELGGGEIYWRNGAGLSMAHGPALEVLRSELRAIGPRLIIFDTLAKVMGLPDENANGAAARVTRQLGNLSAELGATLLLLAHPSKNDAGATTVRGAGELSADLDVLWTLTRGQGAARTVKCIKDRDGDIESRALSFVIESDEGAVRLRHRATDIDPDAEPAADPVETAILEQLSRAPEGIEGGELVRAVREHVGCGRSKAYDSLAALRQSGTVTKSGGRFTLAS